MTAAATANPLKTLRIVEVSIDLVEPHPGNPRRITDDHPSLEGLAQSIRETGLINPITVREDKGVGYEILAGERRWRAAKKAGLKMIAARIVEVTEEQAFHILTVENLQREDLHWTEEARGVEAMLAKGWAAEAIAKAIGRTVQWVALRKGLLELSPGWKKDLANPKSDWHAIPLNKLELIARFPHAAQEHIRAHPHWQVDEMSAKEFDAWLGENYQRKLAKAPWSLDDAKLVPKAGACSACPKRSSCQQQLFGEAKDDRCLDHACWKAKQDASVVAKIEAQRAADPKTLVLKEGYVDDEAPAAIKQADYLHKYDTVGKNDRGAVPAVIANGPKAGQTVYVKPDKQYSNHAPAKAAGPKPLKERLAAFEKRRANVVAAAFLVHLEKEGRKTAPTTLDALKLFHLCLAWGVGTPHNPWEPAEKAIERTIALSKGGTQLLTEAWQAVSEQIHDSVHSLLNASKPPAAAIEVLSRDFGWSDLHAQWIAKAADEIQMPRTLASELALKEATKKPAAAKPKPPAKPKAKPAAAKA